MTGAVVWWCSGVVVWIIRMSAAQRLRPVAHPGRTHADRQQAVTEPCDRGTLERQKYDPQRPKSLR